MDILKKNRNMVNVKAYWAGMPNITKLKCIHDKDTGNTI